MSAIWLQGTCVSNRQYRAVFSRLWNLDARIVGSRYGGRKQGLDVDSVWFAIEDAQGRLSDGIISTIVSRQLEEQRVRQTDRRLT
jgi:hypothetical protein